MAEFEETLNHILGDEAAMGQIMALARSLSGEQEETPKTGEPPDLSAMLGGLDPALLRVGTELLQSTQGQNQRTAALAQALKPFLREERRDRLDRAVRIAGAVRLATAALKMAREKGEDHV